MSSSATAKEQLKEVMKAKAATVEEKGLHRLIVESSLYDGLPTARFLLCEIAVMRMDEDSNYPDDAPKSFHDDKVDWCWLSQPKLALRIGASLSTVEKLIARFIKEGTVKPRYWRDDNKTVHAEYKVVPEIFAAHQRPNQRYDQDRTSRYAPGSRKGKGGTRQRTSGGKFMKVVEDE
ncbi:MAG TPA: hypothetical protein VNZ03_25885 [Terriglobales bacterium]|jgi:hypothetical protein|nr:hypothetical protein [Terriglobales bacterium]